MSDKSKEIQDLTNIPGVQKAKDIPQSSKIEINDNFEIIQKCIDSQHERWKKAIINETSIPYRGLLQHTKVNDSKYDSNFLSIRCQTMWGADATQPDQVDDYRRLEPKINIGDNIIEKDNQTLLNCKLSPKKLPKDLVIDFLQYHKLELPDLTPLQRKDSKVDYYVPTLLSFDPDLSKFKSYLADALRLDYIDPDYEDLKIANTPRVLTLPSGKILVIAHHDFNYDEKHIRTPGINYFTKLYADMKSYRRDQQLTIEKIQATLDGMNTFKDDFETNFEYIKVNLKDHKREDTMQERINNLTSQNHYILTIKGLLEKIQKRTHNNHIDLRKKSILENMDLYIKTATAQKSTIQKQLDSRDYK